MNMGRHVGPFARRLLRPPGGPLYTLTAGAVLVSIWAAAAPMPSGHIALWLGYVGDRASVPAHDFPLIDKPYELSHLAAKVREVLDGAPAPVPRSKPRPKRVLTA